jgi:TPR repeat protein
MVGRINSLICLAEEGNAEAQNFLGVALCTGVGVKKNLEGGFYWYCKAIEQGFVEAKWNAGSILIDGEETIEKNQKLGLDLIIEAAEAGEPGACAFLRDCYKYGTYGFFTDINLSDFWDKHLYNSPKLVFDRPKKMFNHFLMKLHKPNIEPA